MEKEIILFEKFSLPIKLRRLNMCQGGSYRGIHTHVAIEVVVVKSGALDCCIGDDTVKVYPEEIIFINSNIGHRLSSENAEITYLHIDVNLLEKI